MAGQAAKTKATERVRLRGGPLSGPLTTDCAVGDFIVAYVAVRVNFDVRGGRGGIGIRCRFGTGHESDTYLAVFVHCVNGLR